MSPGVHEQGHSWASQGPGTRNCLESLQEARNPLSQPLSLSFPFPFPAGSLSVSRAWISFSQHGISELTCPPGLSASKDLKPLSSQPTPSQRTRLARSGWVSTSLLSTGLRAELVEGTRLLELKAVEGVAEVPRVPAEEGSRLALYPKRCLDYTPAVVSPHPLWRPHFAN